MFAVAIPMLIWMVCNSLKLGAEVAWRVTVALAAVGGVMTVRSFIAQESFEESSRDLALPGWLAGSHPSVVTSQARRHTWFVVTLRKELRLHQMTFVVAGLFAAAWASMLFARWMDPDNMYAGPSLFALSNLYGGVVAIMAGALPAAEERHLGVVDWQVLMPISAWKQWTLKCAVALGVAMILTLGVPALLNGLLPAGDVQFHWEMIFTVLFFSVTGLYVSSLNSTGLRALFRTVPTLAAVAVIGAFLFRPLETGVREWVGHTGTNWIQPHSLSPQVAARMVFGTLATLSMAFSAVVLMLASRNHRSLDRSPVRIVRQAALIAACAILASVALVTVATFLLAATRGLR